MKSENSILPQIVMDYVDLIICKMKYGQKVRQDVRAELLAHFEDALRGVKDDADRQKKAEGLIRDFGDAKVLATLIRRGKKRCRPMWQKAIIRGFQAVGILFLLLVLYIGWFFTGKPVITVNYVDRMNQLVRPVADDNQNAWPLYKEAAAEYKKPDVPDANDFKLLPQKLTNLDDSQRRIVEKWIADNQKAMELIRQGTKRQYYWRTYAVGTSQQETIPSMVAVLLPNLTEYKKLSQLFCWEAYLKAEKGDGKEALDEWITTYDFGRHIRGQNTLLIEQLVGIAIESLACKTITEMLSEYPVDSAILASVQQSLEKVLATENFRISFQSEKLCAYDEIQRCFTQSRFGKGHLYLPRVRSLGPDIPETSSAAEKEMAEILYVLFAFRPDILFTQPNREETQRAIERLYKIYDEMADLSPAVLNKRPEFQKQIEEIFRNNIFMGIVVSDFGNIIEFSCRNQMYRQATITLLAIHRYKLNKGQFPVSLEELVKDGYLEKIPADSYSDKPIVYKPKDGNFVLYSIGPNFEDNGGQSGRNKSGKYFGDIVFWPVHKEEPVKAQLSESSGKNDVK
jgi:hypothetical protein